MKINLTTGIISIIILLMLTAGGWVYSIAISNTDQKHLMIEFNEQKGNFVKHCDKQELREAKVDAKQEKMMESLIRIEERLGTLPRSQRRYGRNEDKDTTDN